MAELHLTDRAVKSLGTDRAQEDFHDDVLEGFGVRVSGRTGRKSFFVRYRVNGHRRRITLGKYPDLSLADARREAKVALYDVARGNDPAESNHDGGDTTFGGLTDTYLEKHAKRNLQESTWSEHERVIEKELDAWEDRPLSEIGRSEIHDVLDRITGRGAPVMANRVKSVVSAIFRFAVSRGMVEENPALRVERPNREQARQRVLEEGEIRAFWKALGPEPPVTAAVFRLRLLTGQRGTEIRAMRWEDVTDGWWTIPADVAKNGNRHRVPLSPQTRSVLDALPSHPGVSPWVFRSPHGGHLSSLSGALSRIRDRTDFYFQARDLRRTAATHMRRMGVPRLHVAKVLNHKVPGITGVYDRSSYDDEKREALDAWGERVDAIVEAESDDG